MTINNAAPSRNNWWIAAAIGGGLIGCCLLSALTGGVAFYVGQNSAPKVAPRATKEPVPEVPAITVDDAKLCYGVVDGSTVPYGDKVELNPATSNTVEGPVVLEWWDGTMGQGHEGMWYLGKGESLTLPRGIRGGYWSIPSDDLDTLIASHLHVVQFGQKPQHDYAHAALEQAMRTCDWSAVTAILVVAPPTGE